MGSEMCIRDRFVDFLSKGKDELLCVSDPVEEDFIVRSGLDHRLELSNPGFEFRNSDLENSQSADLLIKVGDIDLSFLDMLFSLSQLFDQSLIWNHLGVIF